MYLCMHDWCYAFLCTVLFKLCTRYTMCMHSCILEDVRLGSNCSLWLLKAKVGRTYAVSREVLN